MTDTTTIDAEQRPEPDKPVRLNRRTVLTVGTTGIAVLFLGLNLGLRGFSEKAETPTGPINENLLATPEPATAVPNLTYADVTQPKIPDPVLIQEVTKPDPEPPRQTSTQRSSGPSEEQLTAWSSPLFPPSAQALRQAQPQAACQAHRDQAADNRRIFLPVAKPKAIKLIEGDHRFGRSVGHWPRMSFSRSQRICPIALMADTLVRSDASRFSAPMPAIRGML